MSLLQAAPKSRYGPHHKNTPLPGTSTGARSDLVLGQSLGSSSCLPACHCKLHSSRSKLFARHDPHFSCIFDNHLHVALLIALMFCLVFAHAAWLLEDLQYSNLVEVIGDPALNPVFSFTEPADLYVDVHQLPRPLPKDPVPSRHDCLPILKQSEMVINAL